MPEITKRATFYSRKGGEPRTFHVEAEGCIVNITVGLRNRDGQRVTRVDVLPDDESRGGDGFGRIWKQEPGDARIVCVRDPELEDE